MTPTAPTPGLPPGCTLCRKGAYGASWPPPDRIAVNGDGPEYLHLCSVCGTYWKFDMRFANPWPLEKARQGFPAYFVSWTPLDQSGTALAILSGDAFLPTDPLDFRDAPPEGELEQALADAARGNSASVVPLLRESLLRVPSSTHPAPDGSGMTPLALNRPPVVWILAFTRLNLARRFAGDAHWCLEMTGSDLIGRLPDHYGLVLNFGAQSECRIAPQDFKDSIS